QETLRIGNLGTAKEPDIHVRFEGVDVPECRVSYTGRRMAIMQQFSHIVFTLTHNLKPMPRDYTQFPSMRLHPGLDDWITLNRTREPQKLIHDRYTKNRVWEQFGGLGLTRTRSATAGEVARGGGRRGSNHRNLGRTPAS